MLYLVASVVALTVILKMIQGGHKRPITLVPLNKQATILPNPSKGESSIYRSALRVPQERADKDGFVLCSEQHVETLYQIFEKGAAISGDQPFLGHRVNNGPYIWQTYKEIASRRTNFGSGLLNLDVTPGMEGGRRSFIGIFSVNCPEWVITEQACYAYSLVVVPLYDTLGPDSIRHIIEQSEMSVVIVQANKANAVLQLIASGKCKSVRVVVVFGDAKAPLASAENVRVLQFAEVEALGKKNHRPHVEPKPSDWCTLCYTSGTTGEAKGAIQTHANIVSDIAAVMMMIPDDVTINRDDVHISYLPLPHAFERAVMALVTLKGARAGFFRGDVTLLMDDIGELRPTFFPSVPRLLGRLYGCSALDVLTCADRVVSAVNEGGAVKRLLFSMALSSKKALLAKGIVCNNTLWDIIVFKKVRQRLGGRVRFIITGSAPISSAIMEFLRCALGCHVFEGYGQTEAAAATNFTHFGDVSLGSVGAVLPCCEIKLVDVPDMNYTAADKPNPRGEVCFRGTNVFHGYYKKPELTAEAFCVDISAVNGKTGTFNTDQSQWLHSGDVGEFLPNGTLKIIDRKKHIFKLSQGEYVAPEKIEQILLRSNLVAQIFVHGDSLCSCLVAVVVPEFADVQKLFGGTEETIVRSADVRKAILDDLKKLGTASGLKGFELVRQIHLCAAPFAVDNELLTPTFKNKRPALRKHFAREIEAMYRELGEISSA